MKTKEQEAGRQLLRWYADFGRDLPFRNTRDPYKIWICEIIFQQTRIAQGLTYYQNFIARFPDVRSLATADTDEVLLLWQGLGYYSRALNLKKAAQQIMEDYGGNFPVEYEDILKLKGVGRYTAAAISSICFQGNYPAIDGNFYRVFSRVFADPFDISRADAFSYFSELVKPLIPEGSTGDFNQAVMDLGSEICTPRNPDCENCPLQNYCLAFEFEKVPKFPVKTRKAKVENLKLVYYFITFQGKFLIRKRGTDFIWKNLYEFPVSIPGSWTEKVIFSETFTHKLTHKNLEITIHYMKPDSLEVLREFVEYDDFQWVDFSEAAKKSFPQPLKIYLEKRKKDSEAGS